MQVFEIVSVCIAAIFDRVYSFQLERNWGLPKITLIVVIVLREFVFKQSQAAKNLGPDYLIEKWRHTNDNASKYSR